MIIERPGRCKGGTNDNSSAHGSTGIQGISASYNERKWWRTVYLLLWQHIQCLAAQQEWAMSIGPPCGSVLLSSQTFCVSALRGPLLVWCATQLPTFPVDQQCLWCTGQLWTRTQPFNCEPHFTSLQTCWPFVIWICQFILFYISSYESRGGQEGSFRHHHWPFRAKHDKYWPQTRP